ncbi:hypothetical protein ACFSLT_21145 [Novosphingobium resinovorum]
MTPDGQAAFDGIAAAMTGPGSTSSRSPRCPSSSTSTTITARSCSARARPLS